MTPPNESDTLEREQAPGAAAATQAQVAEAAAVDTAIPMVETSDALTEPTSDDITEPTDSGEDRLEATGDVAVNKNGFFKRHKRAILAIGTAAAAAIAVVSSIVPGGRGDASSESSDPNPAGLSAKPQKPVTPEANDVVDNGDRGMTDQDFTQEVGGNVPATAEGDSASDTPELISEEFKPKLMTAKSVDELVAMFEHNLNCFYNGPAVASERCAEILLGDRDGGLTSLLKQRLADVRAYRANNPDFKVTYEIDKVLDSAVDNDRAVIVAQITDSVGTDIKRFTFEKVDVKIEGSVVQDATTSAFVFVREEAVNPGEVNFG